MITFVVDSLPARFTNCGDVHVPDFPMSLTGYWPFARWFDTHNIKYNTVTVENATPESWYPVSLNFWHFGFDYIAMLPDKVKELASQKRIRVLFTYREADSPARIHKHLLQCCTQTGIDISQICVVSGNSNAASVPNFIHFWHFDCSYLDETRHSPKVALNSNLRTHKITCLSRIHKNWREQFVFNVLRHADTNNYISYGNVHYANQLDDFELWNKTNRSLTNHPPIDVELPTKSWHESLPLLADHCDSIESNTHSLIIPEQFQNSYWNIVLETLLETEDSTGVFVTEKTLKPIRNGQSFVVLGCANTLRMLHEHGYQSFSNIIDESYDNITDIRERWVAIYNLTKYFLSLSISELQQLQEQCVPIIQHNQAHFWRSREDALRDLTNSLTTGF